MSERDQVTLEYRWYSPPSASSAEDADISQSVKLEGFLQKFRDADDLPAFVRARADFHYSKINIDLLFEAGLAQVLVDLINKHNNDLNYMNDCIQFIYLSGINHRDCIIEAGGFESLVSILPRLTGRNTSYPSTTSIKTLKPCIPSLLNFFVGSYSKRLRRLRLQRLRDVPGVIEELSRLAIEEKSRKGGSSQLLLEKLNALPAGRMIKAARA